VVGGDISLSGSIGLNIVTGADWAVQLSWTDSLGNPILYTDPLMDIRQELNPKGQVIARFDSTGNLDGLISIPQIGTSLLQMSAAKTTNLQTGYGFWDLFVTVNGSRVRLAFGTVSITPHVTVVS
jgi:hypothetical protein